MYGWVPSLFTWNYHSIVNRLHPKTKQKVQKKKVLIPGCCFSVILLPTGSGIWTRDLHFYPQEIWCMTPPISLWETVAWRTRVCALSRFSYVWLCVTLWTRAHQAPLSMGFSRQEYWSGLLCHLPGDLPEPGLELTSLTSPALQVGSLLLVPPGKPGLENMCTYMMNVEKAMAPHSSTLAWTIPWTEEPVRLQSMGSLRVGHDWATSLWLFTFMHWRRKWQPTPVFLPGDSQGWGSLVGCRLWGRTESDTIEVT